MSALAFLFPGQGSQAVGMLSEIAQHHAAVAACFAESSEALGYDLWQLVQEGPADRLALTEFTQPAILTASVALYRVWLAENGGRPDYVAGHSLGEYSALVAAGVMSLADAARLVQRRGQAMQSAVPVGEGAMAAIIGLDDAQIVDICEAVSTEYFVGAVNFNAPGQVVIAGHAGAVARAIEALKEAGAKRALPLPVSAPFHTPLMQPAADAMADGLSQILLHSPDMPVMSNVTAQPQTDPETIRRLLVEQVVSPVRWTECVQALLHCGCQNFVECGPGKVLSGLLKRIDKSAACYAIEAPAGLEEARLALPGKANAPEER